jgi:hypothetical protein
MCNWTDCLVLVLFVCFVAGLGRAVSWGMMDGNGMRRIWVNNDEKGMNVWDPKEPEPEPSRSERAQGR